MTPLPRHVALRRQRVIRSITRQLQNGTAIKTPSTHLVAKILRERAEDAARRADPFEQARTFLGQRGYPVYDRRVVYQDPAGGWQVGRRILADCDAVIAYAVGIGWARPA